MKHDVKVISVDKAGLGLNLCYAVDDKEYNVTGEFFIDKHGVLHHTHITEDGEEVEVVYQYDQDRRYLVVQRVGGKDEFVWDEEATNTAVDCPNGEDDYLTYLDASELLEALKANAEKKGWVNAKYFIQEV